MVVPDNTTELVVKIAFNPVNFLYDFERVKRRVRRIERKNVFPESPDVERVVRELEEEEAKARRRYKEINGFLEKWSRSTGDKARVESLCWSIFYILFTFSYLSSNINGIV